MPPSVAYLSLAEALRERRKIIADRELYNRDPEAHLTRLQVISGQIEESAKRLPTPIDPNLAHYLQRCSFDKALAFIESKYLGS